MALETMTKMLSAAKDGKYAVGAFNIVDYNSMKAVAEAAEDLSAPVIVQTSVKTVSYWSPSTIVSWMKELARGASVPIALHLDHCKNVDFVKQCIDAGWSSVMFDGSATPFEQNLADTLKVAGMAEAAGISVEAELGRIGGVEEDIVVRDGQANLADPEEAVEFCRRVKLAVFAPAIGTAHGVYKGKPEIAFDRIEEISSRTGIPLALHGGTGLEDTVFQKCVSLGCAKVNISTQIKYAFIDGFVDYHNEHKMYEPLKPLKAQFDRMKKEVTENIKIFGSAGKAAKG